MISLIQETAHPRFYPAKIDYQHHQLKHRIRCKNSDTVYYCSGQEIYALHLRTQTRELIKSLPWAPVCLDAAYGWVCVGGWERGNCAFIRVESGPAICARSGQRAEVDDLLPLDLCRESRIHPSRGPRSTGASSGTAKYELYTRTIGSSIVNAVSIVKLKIQQNDSHDEICAIVSNNDQSVQILSMRHMRVICHIRYPIPMNHASISPDGLLLVAVGDGPNAFFHRRSGLREARKAGGQDCAYYPCNTSENPQDVRTVTSQEDMPSQRAALQKDVFTGWRFLAESRVPHTFPDDACFTTSFSSSGRVCAIASQSGSATIYDVDLIAKGFKPCGAIIKSFRSSRPHGVYNDSGAFRSMSFSPAPWDLLVCAEDQGRIVVLDLRSLGMVKQTIELSTAVARVNLMDMKIQESPEEHKQVDPRRRSWGSHPQALETQNSPIHAVSSMTDYAANAANPSRIERASISRRTPATQDQSDGLTESELRMIDTIGLRRHPPNENAPNLANYPIDLSHQMAARDFIDLHHLPPPSHLSNRLQPSATQPRSTANEQDQGNPRSRPPHRSRRRSSIVMATSHSDSGQMLSETPNSTRPRTASFEPLNFPARHSSNVPDIEMIMSSHRAPPSHPPAVDPWQTITDAMTADRHDTTNAPRSAWPAAVRQTSETSDYSRASEVTPDQAIRSLLARNERQRNLMGINLTHLRQTHAATEAGRRAEELLAGLDGMEYLGEPGLDQSYQGRNGVVVMGVDWGDDGRHLFVGTEDGVLEYAVNIRNRMQWPAEQVI